MTGSSAFSAARHVLTLPRGRAAGRGTAAMAHVVDYRHVIHALRRKPMALLGLVYRDRCSLAPAYRRRLRGPARRPSPRACLPHDGGSARARS